MRRFVREMATYARGCGSGGLIDVDAGDGGAGGGGGSGAQSVVEDVDAGCVGDVGEEEGGDFGVVGRGYGGVCRGGEVGAGGGDGG